MKLIAYILPVALLVAYSQIVVKWRTTVVDFSIVSTKGFLSKLFIYLSDPYILSGYAMALLGSFMWLVVISRIPLSIGFPIYIGITFLLVILGGWFFLGEQITPQKLLAISIIFVGVTLGVSR